jgi:uncharacterized protein (DUF697 family)
VIEAVQRDALDSMGALFEQVGDESSGRVVVKEVAVVVTVVVKRSKIRALTPYFTWS